MTGEEILIWTLGAGFFFCALLVFGMGLADGPPRSPPPPPLPEYSTHNLVNHNYQDDGMS